MNAAQSSLAWIRGVGVNSLHLVVIWYQSNREMNTWLLDQKSTKSATKPPSKVHFWPLLPTHKCDCGCSRTLCLQYFSLHAFCWWMLRIVIIIRRRTTATIATAATTTIDVLQMTSRNSCVVRRSDRTKCVEMWRWAAVHYHLQTATSLDQSLLNPCQPPAAALLM